MVFRPIFESGLTAFNRTSLELKTGSDQADRKGQHSFNRTSLELKNQWGRTLKQRNANLQSHLTGIEKKQFHLELTVEQFPSIAPHWNWKSQDQVKQDPYIRPSIAPHWNWKPPTAGVWWAADSPSIAPHWNWKFLPPVSWFGPSTLQSHLTGIEKGKR